jgi:hypothetical protein
MIMISATVFFFFLRERERDKSLKKIKMHRKKKKKSYALVEWELICIEYSIKGARDAKLVWKVFIELQKLKG